MKEMNFEEFVEHVGATVKGYLPEEYMDAVVDVRQVLKNNDTQLHGMCIRKPGETVSPTIYLDSFYKKYENGDNLTDIVKEIAKLRAENHDGNNFDSDMLDDFEQIKHMIMPRLVNAGWNEESLKDRPHILIEDLAVIFAIIVDDFVGGNASITISNFLAAKWDVSTEELYEIALSNLETAKDENFQTMATVLAEIMGMSEEEFNQNMPLDEGLHVLTNNKRVHGAVEVLNKQVMESIREQMGTDFYIVPSSVHEVLIVPVDGMEVADLNGLICSVNATEVEAGDRLSDHAYIYTSEGLKVA